LTAKLQKTGKKKERNSHFSFNNDYLCTVLLVRYIHFICSISLTN